MRVPTAESGRRRFRPRVWVLVVAAVVVLLAALSLRGLARFYTDYLWFDSVGFGDTWRRLITARVVPAAAFTVVFFVVMFVNLVIADRLAPKYRSMGPEDELIERYQRSTARYRGRIRVGVALFFALVAGVGVSAQWQQWLLFTNRKEFGVKDPQFGMDVGFYVFQLPFLRFIVDWFFAGLVIVLIVTAIAHYLNGGIRLQSPFQRVTPQVKAHLSVILAVMALVKTAEYYLARFQLNLSGRGVVEGASATDVHAQLPALNLLMIISIAAAGLFLWNISRRGWVLPIIAVGLWAFVSLVVGTVYPAYYQKFRVDPNEFAREEPYIGRNIDATRSAFGLADIEEVSYPFDARFDAEVASADATSIDNARLWDPEVIQSVYQTLQALQTYYQVDDVDIDRYEVDGSLSQVLIAPREINREELPSQSWVNRTIVYTHGYGIVAGPATVARDGQPQFYASDIPLEDTTIPVDQPRLYFGEGLGGYVVVDAEQDEFDYAQSDGPDVTTRYEGTDGVVLSNVFKRAAFAMRESDFNLMISGQIDDSTRLLMHRDIRDRIEQAAPFLRFDADPYPVVVDGRVVWVLDGYTTTTDYPYAQTTTGSGGLEADFNYVRNSVKATIDAYDGTITYYVMPVDDPMIEAWSSAFPDLFTDYEEMPEELKAHLRYPQDLFRVQSDVYADYHVTDDRRFYQGDGKWLLSPDPDSGRLGETPTADTDSTATTAASDEPQDATSTSRRMDPLYLVQLLPGEEDVGPQFVLLQPFVPVSADNKQTRLVSFMVARSDPGQYGKMTSYVMPEGQTVIGPTQVNNEINSQPDISREFTLLNQSGSQVVQGSLQLVPVGRTVLYVRPIYVVGAGGSARFATFRFIVAYTQGKQAVIADSIEDAIDQIVTAPQDDAEPPPGTGGEPETPTTTTTAPPGSGAQRPVEEILAEATEAYNAAQVALDQGDLGEYQRQVDRLGALLDEAARATGATTTEPTTAVDETAPTGSDGI